MCRVIERIRKRKGVFFMSVYPEYINVKDECGNINKVPYKEIKKHEEEVIKDNIVYGYLHCEYSEKEIKEYERTAYIELKELKKQIRENPDIVLELEHTTERYVVSNIK